MSVNIRTTFKHIHNMLTNKNGIKFEMAVAYAVCYFRYFSVSYNNFVSEIYVCQIYIVCITASSLITTRNCENAIHLANS